MSFFGVGGRFTIREKRPKIFGGSIDFGFEDVSLIFVESNKYHPKNPDPSKMAILRTRTPAIQVQTLPLEGPRILRAGKYHVDLCV